MLKAFKIMSISLQNELEYRFNYIISVIGSFIPFIVNLLIWYAVDKNYSNDMTYSFPQIVNYFFWILLIGNVINSTNNTADLIRTGEINLYLIKPFNYTLYCFLIDIPKRLFFLIVSFVLIVVSQIWFSDYIVVNISLVMGITFVCSLVLGYVINFLLIFILNEFAFSFTQISLFMGAYNVILNIISGKLLPLDMFPKTMKNILEVLPFQYCGYYQAKIITDGFDGNMVIVKKLLIGVGWFAILLLFSNLYWRKGVKKYSAYGG